MYEMLVESLRNCVADENGCCFRCPEDCNGPCQENLMTEAADAIEGLEKACEEAYNKGLLEGGIAQRAEDEKWLPKWIPVTERLPEIGTYIIAGRMKYDYEKAYTHFVDVAYFGPRWNDADCSWQTFNDWCEGQQEFVITHWMPLPEPPKEET